MKIKISEHILEIACLKFRDEVWRGIINDFNNNPKFNIFNEEYEIENKYLNGLKELWKLIINDFNNQSKFNLKNY